MGGCGGSLGGDSTWTVALRVLQRGPRGPQADLTSSVPAAGCGGKGRLPPITVPISAGPSWKPILCGAEEMPETVVSRVRHEACPAVSLPTPHGCTVVAPILQMRMSRLRDRSGSHADLVPSPEPKAQVP